VSDLFGHAGRELLDRLEIPDPWRPNIDVSLALIDDLDLQIAALTVKLKRQGVDHRYIPLLVTASGIGWINAYTIASEIGDIGRFASPAKLCGYTGLCPRVKQSGATDARGPLSKHGPKYLRWALFEAALNACKHPYLATVPRNGRSSAWWTKRYASTAGRDGSEAVVVERAIRFGRPTGAIPVARPPVFPDTRLPENPHTVRGVQRMDGAPRGGRVAQIVRSRTWPQRDRGHWGASCREGPLPRWRRRQQCLARSPYRQPRLGFRGTS